MTAGNGEIALNTVKARAKNKQISLILMDLEMPVMNGYQSAKAITDFCQDSSIKVPFIVALTAHEPNQSIIDKCEKHGLRDILAKPIRADQVTTLLNKVGMTNNY